MIRFRLFGIPVRVEPFFWLTLALLGGAIDARTSEGMTRLALFILAGFVSVLVHELGHALAMRKFGAHAEITLHAFGGYAVPSGRLFTRPQDFLITAAGPGVQLLLGFAVALSLPHLGDLPPNARYFARCLIIISYVWGFLNLLPVLPLDGGRLLNAVLGPQRVHITLWTTILVSAAGVIFLLKKTDSILFPIFLGFFGWQAWQALRDHRRI